MAQRLLFIDRDGTLVEVANTLCNVGYCYTQAQQYDKALPYYDQALAMNRKLLGEEHPTVGTTLNNIGLLYYNSAHYDKAARYFADAIAIARKAYGDTHPTTATEMLNLANAYENLGEKKKAIAAYRQALAACQALGNGYEQSVTVIEEKLEALQGK